MKLTATDLSDVETRAQESTVRRERYRTSGVWSAWIRDWRDAVGYYERMIWSGVLV